MPRIQGAKVAVKIDPKISIGFGTVSGILFAVAQYLGAIGMMLAGDLTAESVTAMTTATFTLITTLAGRFKQADSAIKAITNNATPDSTPDGNTTPEANVLYLDGDAIAAALVKSLNTSALLAAMARPEPATVETSTPAGGE